MIVLAIMTTISTVALAIITFYYARINAKMLCEMKQARGMALQPMLSVKLIPFIQEKLPEGGFDIKAISLKNIGNAPAIKTLVEFELSFGELPYKKGKTFIGQMGIEEKKIPLSEALLGEDINIQNSGAGLRARRKSLVLEMIKLKEKGYDVTHLTLRVTMSYFNSYGIHFTTSQVFDKDLPGAWKLISQEHQH